ncbi:IgGFc-binding protein-like [Anomaloglossus baeobatrachus]|uniref:IgGFc-binding protein-like n=1 Tax=Anomaloglossus baeobatrachus TaxID=238106 RepID=UPI003F4F86A2
MSTNGKNFSKCTPGPEGPPPCTDDDKVTISSNSFCGLITDKNGPFKDCHGVVDPLVYFNNCVFDLCELNLDPGTLCDSLQSYAQSCQSNGVVIGPWRNETFCPLKCPQNSHFEPCGTACPATCVNPVSPSNCNLPCTESCICDPGFVLHNKECVPSLQCGCWENDKHYPVGSEFWTDDTCTTKCRCPSSGGGLVCKSDSCSSDQYCSVTNGIPGCVYYSYGICRVHNDPHYETFDKQTHHFMGLCTYTLSKLCTNSSLPYFNVEAKNVHRGNPSVSYVQRVIVDVYGYRIQIVNKEKSRILVDDVWRTLPVILNGGAVKVELSGRYVVLETDFKLRVAYDTDHTVELKLPDPFSGEVCGMCGNYNNHRPDDFLMPNGQLAPNSNELGNSWIVYDKNDPSCTDQPPPPPPPTCPPEDENRYESDAFCGLLTNKDGLFSVCHAVVDPESFFESCVFDLCALNGGKDILCSALQAYADACQKEGVTIPNWRNITSCGGIECPSNSEYNECMTACPATCLDPQAPEKCTSPCVEGCQCKDGFILSGGVCITKSQCGCWYNDQYYNKGDEFIEGNCVRRCQCQENSIISCLPMSCPEDEICKAQNGLLGCYPPSTSICHIYGDPHYSTFDGTLHHFQGSCNYTVSETCANTSHSFSVTTRNEHRGNPSWTAINSVALTVDGVHIRIEKNNIVHVNNVSVTLPTDVSGISIIRSGQYVVVNTNFGLQIKFNGDHELFVIVSEKYKDKLCGLCGTYNDNRFDDFTTLNGSIVTDVNDFGNSWQVPDNGWPCDSNPPPPPTCLPNIEQEAEAKCEIINLLNGPFAQCHALIPPYQYFESCVYDQCATGGNDDYFCSSLEFYAAACEAIGVILGDWRKEANCEVITSTSPPKTTTTATTTTTTTIPPTTIGCDTVGTTTSTTPDKPTTPPKPIVSTTPDKCQIGCSFDTDFCNWKQSKSDNIDWIRWRGATPSDLTGPSFDHTTGDGYYLYIDGQKSKEGDLARLESPANCFTGYQCLRFWYHMYGVAEYMELIVAVLRDDGIEEVVFLDGSYGDMWHLEEIFLPDSDIIQIFIDGRIGEDYRSDVAIDDISLTPGYCDFLCRSCQHISQGQIHALGCTAELICIFSEFRCIWQLSASAAP